MSATKRSEDGDLYTEDGDLYYDRDRGIMWVRKGSPAYLRIDALREPGEIWDDAFDLLMAALQARRKEKAA